MERFIGLDVHSASCTAGILDAQGKRLRSVVLETHGEALIEFVKTQPGKVHLCMEEGTQSAWLYEILEPHVSELVVVHVGEEKSRGRKDDEHDAFELAERLRTGSIQARVYKGVGPYSTLRALVKAHTVATQDTVRVQCRIKALFRSRGISTAGKEIYGPRKREAYLAELPASHRSSAEFTYREYDAVREVREGLEKDLVTESHRQPISHLLETVPGLGPIRVAQLVATVVTPERFRTRSKFWSYCGLGLVLRTSSDWVQNEGGRWDRAKVQSTRGLNRNRNAVLKYVFKGAATSVIQRQDANEPLYQDYKRLLAAGTKPNLAKLTLARKIASIALTLWKRKEEYNPKAHRKQNT